MYTMVESQLSMFDDVQPFGDNLDPENRWIRLAHLIDWQSMEREYAANFGKVGAQALPMRMAFGSLVIRQALDLSDRQTVMLITENPYMQYFIGMPGFTNQLPFAPHSMATFRTRFSEAQVEKAVKQLRKLSRAKKAKSMQ